MSAWRDRLAWERRQVWIYAAAIALGLAVGGAAPRVAPGAELLLWPVLVVLLYSAFVQVPLRQVLAALRDVRFAAAALIGNFVVMPLFVWAAVGFLPEDPAIRLGVLLVLLVPCTDWFISFTQIAGGDVARAVAVTPINLVLQFLLLPVYLLLMAQEEVTGVLTAEVVGPALLVVAVPLAAAALTEVLGARRPRAALVRERAAWAPIPLLAAVLFLVAAAQVATVRDSLHVLPAVVPVFLGFLVVAAITAKVVATVMSLPPAQGRTLAFGMSTRNSFVVLPLALALPQGFEVAAMVVVTQSLVELLGMVVFVWVIPRLFRTDRSATSAP